MIMKTKYLLRNFMKFLKFNNAYDNYILNLKEAKGEKKKTIDFIVRHITYDPENIIIHAFTWYSSKKQKKTWGELHREWQMLLNKYYDK